MTQSEYEKKRDRAANKYIDKAFGDCDYCESNENSFKAGSDFGREYSKAEYDQLMKDARALREQLNIAKSALEKAYAFDGIEDCHSEIKQALKKLKKYPQANEKE